VHRSSESVASLAAALAKAQAELVNPEKTLVATIRPQTRGEVEQSFRYAPLSSGLDIVRKTLGRHEIATIQTTAVDASTAMINLTTMLAHASGEWIASDWPVCPVADMAAPKRMGAALTYARRYALFTLVGIAGEDDLDAPDLNDAGEAKISPAADQFVDATRRGRQDRDTGSRCTAARTAKAMPVRTRPTLDPGWSEATRQQLLTEIAALDSSDEAASWARKGLEVKNALTLEDARIVEEAFALRLTGIGEREEEKERQEEGRGLDGDERESREGRPEARQGQQLGESPRGVHEHRGVQESLPSPSAEDLQGPKAPRTIVSIDKSILALSEPRRYRNKEHRNFVCSQPCLVCGRTPSDAHHVGFAQPRAFGLKVSDEFTVPLCRAHHRALHRAGQEAEWWKEIGVDPITAARKLWKEMRLNYLRALANSAGRSGDAKKAVTVVQDQSDTKASRSIDGTGAINENPDSEPGGQ
jgi:ERF superfamily